MDLAPSGSPDESLGSLTVVEKGLEVGHREVSGSAVGSKISGPLTKSASGLRFFQVDTWEDRTVCRG